jgi:hypothetical protein
VYETGYNNERERCHNNNVLHKTTVHEALYRKVVVVIAVKVIM